ncbi:MAG TPA: transcriptional regulator [Rhodospirillaceae bacterium]|nr:transcriptional regulator [Halobacteriovoraceae bacterium]HAT35913.1 transcriptional regulator [Rhodospirillaceae bacterium]|tara:strand:+ start:298 stop:645 length:348 start_codon:yes stop_codon:yes gene_type:complete
MTEQIVAGSGNVFADLGLEDAEELSLKATLAMQVASIIKHRHLTQKEAGQILDIPQPHVSKLLNGKLESFSAERLLRMLLKLGRDIDIVIKKRKSASTTGALSVATSKNRIPVAA